MHFQHWRAVATLAVFAVVLSLKAAPDSPNKTTEESKAGGWKMLFDGKTTAGWHQFNKTGTNLTGWDVADGWLHCQGKGGSDLLSNEKYGDFELSWEWRLSPAGNSGVKYFVQETGPSPKGHEYQMIDEEGEPDAKKAGGKRVSAALYDVVKPERGSLAKPAGQINQSRVVVKGDVVEHWLNGTKVLSYSCGSESFKKAVAESKFWDSQYFGKKITGHILLQNHHTGVWFRNIKVRVP